MFKVGQKLLYVGPQTTASYGETVASQSFVWVVGIEGDNVKVKVGTTAAPASTGRSRRTRATCGAGGSTPSGGRAIPSRLPTSELDGQVPMFLAIIEPLLFLPMGVVVLTLLEDPRWIAQGIARLLRPAAKRWRLHCRNGRCR